MLYNTVLGYELLLKNRKIPYQDVAGGVLFIFFPFIITPTAMKADLKGELNSPSSRAGHQTIILCFVVIKVLEGKGNPYRHNLDSYYLQIAWAMDRDLLSYLT